jgi:Cation transport ATPase
MTRRRCIPPTVGISVMTGADVARDAAHIILGKPSLEVLHRGILEGRRASQNMMKYLLMGTSSNFGNMFSMAIASVFLPFLPMLPTQILLNNCLYDMAQITIPTDHVDRGSISLPQRWDMRLIRDFMLYVGPVSSLFDFLTFYVLLHVLHATEAQFHTGWFVESLATQTLVLFHPHDGQSVDQPPEPGAGDLDGLDRGSASRCRRRASARFSDSRSRRRSIFCFSPSRR